ncbi:carbohydrate ABC transporter permease [Acholeplasma vituli]|uniref:Carbohydrate ABC transporter permease n=1 Tax=Paracholeplasma vituli TaxID=69473 RepID=A0ABT2PTL2_9MOLU|nr:carbohydrate ABC transporter permease [Paracholeplasma vituli]MCU0104277.1 carbohydrate ABC transporter permease [Paracholeplasma vituli]
MTTENKSRFMNQAFEKLKNESQKVYDKRFSTSYKRKMTFESVLGWFALMVKYFLLYGLSFIILYPLIQQISIALRAPEDINNPLVLWIPETFSMMNFKISVIVLDYWTALKNSIMISGIVTILQILSTSLVGYAFARLKFKGQGILFGIVVASIVVAPSTIELPLKLTLMNFLGTGTSLLGSPNVLYILAATGMGIKSGIFIYLFRQFFRGIPEELEEAAHVDGANPLQVFFKVMLPNARGAMVLVGILSFVWQWNDAYFTANFVSKMNSDFATLTTKMMSIRNAIQGAIQQAGVWQLFDQDVTQNPLFTSMVLNTSAMLAMIPLLIFYLLVQKILFTEGIERSGLVG